MVRAELRMARRPVRRPLGLSILSVAGVGLGLALGTLAMALALAQVASGDVTGAVIVGVTGLVLALAIIWPYWGLWEMFGSAWWSHVVAGPPAVVALALLLWAAPDTLGLAAGLLPEQLRELGSRTVTAGALLLLVVECAVVGYLPLVRGVFGIGAPKQAWER